MDRPIDLRSPDLPFDPATLPGLSEKLLRSHHQSDSMRLRPAGPGQAG